MKKDIPRELIHGKYRYLTIAVLGWAIFFVSFFGLKHSIKPVYYIHSPIDDMIPFCKYSVFAYCLWYIYLFVPLLVFALKDKNDFIRLQAYIFTGMGFCVLLYAFYPNAINFRPVIVPTDFPTWLAHALFSVDTSNMVTPSMHVFDAVAIHLGLIESRLTRGHKRLLALSFVVMLLICASTVLLKQHSVIDVFWGVVLAFVLYIPFYEVRRVKARKNA